MLIYWLPIPSFLCLLILFNCCFKRKYTLSVNHFVFCILILLIFSFKRFIQIARIHASKPVKIRIVSQNARRCLCRMHHYSKQNSGFFVVCLKLETKCVFGICLPAESRTDFPLVCHKGSLIYLWRVTVDCLRALPSF